MVSQHFSSLLASYSDRPGILIQEQSLHQSSSLYEDLELFFSVLTGFRTHPCICFYSPHHIEYHRFTSVALMKLSFSGIKLNTQIKIFQGEIQ